MSRSIENLQKDNTAAIIIVGDPGVRKTTLALHFPSPYFFDCDGNLKAAAERVRPENLEFDYGNRDDKDVFIEPPKRYAHLVSCLNTAAANPKIRTLVLDSLTTLTDILISEAKRLGGLADDKAMRIQDWGTFAYLMKNLIGKLRTCGKTLVVIAHQVFDKDEVDGRMKLFLNVPGQARATLSGLFTDCWQPFTKISGVGNSQTRQWLIRTLPMSEVDHRGVKASFPTLSDLMPYDDLVKFIRENFK